VVKQNQVRTFVKACVDPNRGGLRRGVAESLVGAFRN
jgi:hypothetical protein